METRRLYLCGAQLWLPSAFGRGVNSNPAFFASEGLREAQKHIKRAGNRRQIRSDLPRYCGYHPFDPD